MYGYLHPGYYRKKKKTKGKFLYLVRWNGRTMVILCCSKNNKINSSISSK